MAKCVKVIVSFFYDVTEYLISSLTLFSYNAEVVFIFQYTGKCDMIVSKYSGTTLCRFDTK